MARVLTTDPDSWAMVEQEEDLGLHGDAHVNPQSQATESSRLLTALTDELTTYTVPFIIAG